MNKTIDNLLSHTGDVALRRRAKWIIQKLGPKNGEKILDLGCGDGFYLYLLSNLGIKLNLFGADFDINALNSAKKNINSKNFKLIKADIMEKLPFKDDFFDGIVMSEVLEHLPDDIKCMKEVRRILKKGGRVVLSVPNINYPLFWDPISWILQRIFNTHIKSGFWAGIWNQHLRLYNLKQLIDLLEKERFKKIDSEVLTNICLPFNHYLLNIFAIILSKKKNLLSKSPINKFTGGTDKKSFNPFYLLFLFDKLNNKFRSVKTGVSVVASAIK